MTRSSRAFVASVVALASCAAPLTVPDVPEVVKDLRPTLPQGEFKGVSIVCHTGTVRVDQGPVVALTGMFRARGGSETEAKDRCDAGELRIERTADGFLEIRCVVPPSCPLVNIDFSLVLTAPAAMPIRVHLDEGHVAVRSRSGPLAVRSRSASVSARLTGGSARIESSTGDILVHGKADELDLVTESGSVVASFMNGEPLPGQLAFRSKEGSLTLELPFDAKLSFEHVTRTGKLISEFPVDWQIRTDGPERIFSGTIGSSPTAKLRAVTEVGDVELKMLSAAPFGGPVAAPRP